MIMIFRHQQYSYKYYVILKLFLDFPLYVMFVCFSIRTHLDQSIVKKGRFCCQRHLKVAVRTEKRSSTGERNINTIIVKTTQSTLLNKF